MWPVPSTTRLIWRSQPGSPTAWIGDQNNNRQNPMRAWGELPLL
jgi:hypothetical protein